MGAISGNIGAIGTFAAAVVFSPQGRGSKQDANLRRGEGFAIFSAAVPLSAPSSYTQLTKLN
jgi:hypothetical protein